ncbi:TPA: hypothetical protein ACNVXW_003901 [Klebsiella aerogenes]|uniref:hypothetical protein n=1 Tax=Klebsiella aerogenes TaxID=548 RepID=UPI00063C900E|nr:hypothetical protein [Klebsiella aerogenes]EIV2086177.1 hypothetical protein [Klebsiella aerogenes]EIW9214418.1 hypothetical protein [Klebsiella aerogenes]EMF0805911.1 hypothetical protein [Klebsiella aerogenes]KLF57643.1 hypothetical protein YA35_05140 [Klebsiella aerogenes]MBK0468515.1 hypothetical protein [Klebsiella aerogenes]
MNISAIFRLFPFAIIMLAGCQAHRQANAPITPPIAIATDAQQNEKLRLAAEQERLNACRQALDSLKEVNPKEASRLGSEFTALIGAASQYNSVRTKVADPTRQGIDSMYQFKSIKLCADIEKSLIDSLVMRGDNAVK